MDLVNATARFLHRHRRALTVGVGIGMAGYAAYKIKRWREEYYQIMKELEDARFDQRRSECVPALFNFMQTLKKRVNETVDVTSAVKKLKQYRSDPSVSKEETALLWEQVKVSGFTRFVLAFYGFNLLNVMLRVQVHILGRYAFESSNVRDGKNMWTEFGMQVEEGGEGSPSMAFTNEDRRRLLSLVYEYFLGSGLKKLKELVEVVVAEELSAWPVHEKVKVQYNELYDTFTRIRRRLEGPRGVTNELFPLLRYVIDMEPKEEDLHGKLNEMINETWDALESASFKLALEDCLDATFRVFLEDLHRNMFVGRQTRPRQDSGAVEEKEDHTMGSSMSSLVEEESLIEEAQPPLANLIPYMKNAANQLFLDDPEVNTYIKVTSDVRSVNLLCSSFFASDYFYPLQQ